LLANRHAVPISAERDAQQAECHQETSGNHYPMGIVQRVEHQPQFVAANRSLIAGASDPACLFHIANGVFERRRASAKIDCRIPESAMGHRYLRRQIFEMAAMILVRLACLEIVKL
jgi:hypothetical protein